MKGKRKRPYLWIPTLFSAEALPMAIVTFVSTLMFIQTDTPNSLTTLYCALILTPWVFKPFLKRINTWTTHTTCCLRWAEVIIFFCLIALAFSMSKASAPMMTIILFIMSTICAWHSILTKIYFNRRMEKSERLVFRSVVTTSYQASTIITYGLHIILVGGLEVFFKNLHDRYSISWSMGTYMLAGIFFTIMVVNFAILTNAHRNGESTNHDMVIQPMGKLAWKSNLSKQSIITIIALMLLVLPQSLMFYARVFFLYMPVRNGGLGCSMQEIGFAQGTIGVMAFALGISIGRHIVNKRLSTSTLWIQTVVFTLSPLFYFLMTYQHPQGITQLCVMTFLSQICFGFGFNCCLPLIGQLTGNKHKLANNYLQIPLLVAIMIPPLAISGTLVSNLGFHNFFLIDCLTAPIAWIFLIATRTITNCIQQTTTPITSTQ